MNKVRSEDAQAWLYGKVPYPLIKSAPQAPTDSTQDDPTEDKDGDPA